jgi:molybdate transport system permease protein
VSWDPVRLSLQVMLVATPAIFVIGLALAILLARRTFRGQIVVETLVIAPG